ncbi:50S ribosomal protein L18 [Candidatus Peregrinibacteria bacterium]|nr:50S ribosomal protein L18 [Candidatus Peregrinibacteria bacterium]
MKLSKPQKRIRRHARIRSRVAGTAYCPRLAVYRSLKGIYAQLIDDLNGQILVSSSSLKMKKSSKTDLAKEVGKDLAKKAMEKNIKTCVFDRGGFLYHGRVKALAEGAREGGLQF